MPRASIWCFKVEILIFLILDMYVNGDVVDGVKSGDKLSYGRVLNSFG